MTAAIAGLVCAVVFIGAAIGVIYLRKKLGVSQRHLDYLEQSARNPPRPGLWSRVISKFTGSKPKRVEKPNHRRQRHRSPSPADVQQPPSRAVSVAEYSEPMHSNIGFYAPTTSMGASRSSGPVEAPIPGLFDIPSFDDTGRHSNSRQPSLPQQQPPIPMMPMAHHPAPVARGAPEPGYAPARQPMRSTQSAADMAIVDRRFPENPLPTDMPAIVAHFQNNPQMSRSQPQLLAVPYVEDPRQQQYRGNSASGSSSRPELQHYDPRHEQQQQQQQYQRPPRHHRESRAARGHSQQQPGGGMAPVPPLLAPPPMPQPVAYSSNAREPGFHSSQPLPPPLIPVPAPQEQRRFNSPEEEEQWKQSNRMTLSSPPAYSALYGAQ